MIRRLTRRGLVVLCCGAVVGSAAAGVRQNPVADAARPAYLFVMGTTTNADVIGRYARTLPPIYQEFGGFYLAVGNTSRNLLVLAGKFQRESIVLARFPASDGPNALWWSPQYRRSARMRAGAGIFDVVKLRGIPGDLAGPEGRPAYLISIVSVSDREKLQSYEAAVEPLLRDASARHIVHVDRKDIELLEGDFGNLSVSIVQFPTIEALRSFYDHPSHRALIPVREDAGDFTVLAIEGFEPTGKGV
jgi:uncharacterized protein (DUF1330 family)